VLTDECDEKSGGGIINILSSSITVQPWQWFVHNAGTTQECKMPNGRSGGFVIETEDLRELVKAVSDTNSGWTSVR